MTGRRTGAGRALKVSGVPPDLLQLAAALGEPTAAELCAAFYLPAELTAAFIELGLARGVWTRTAGGALRLAHAPPHAGEAPTPPPPGFARAVWTLMERRGELCAADAVLLLAGEPDLEAALVAPGRKLWVRDDPPGSGHPAGPVTRISADLRYVEGFCFGVFARVICPPSLGGPRAPILEAVLANLARHGAAYVGLSLADRERQAVVEALSNLESALVLTDLLEERGTLVFRAVRYPELRGNPEFLRYYVD